MVTLKVTAKGQITLKKELQRHLNVRPGDQMEVVALPNGKLEISAVRPRQEGGLDKFFGSLKNGHDIHASLDDISQAIEDGWAGRVSLDDHDDR
ncbi:MAG: AbrB/MazE/SpoVT family DNA-binding domain-containing protein [Neorhizobium sp.]|nr:AbrB/MazE/SpoVT family DNA-binding domain-containing protein [Neorhizobium sp.]